MDHVPSRAEVFGLHRRADILGDRQRSFLAQHLIDLFPRVRIARVDDRQLEARAEARLGVALDLACLPCFGEVLWTDLTGERPLQPDAYDSLIARALDAAAKVGEQLATAARDHVARLDAVREASLEAAVAS